MSDNTIEIIARAIILDNGGKKILFCAPKSLDHFYLPGGHIEFGETAESALVRELFEETGADASEAEFLFAGTDENIFTQENIQHHEINIYFEVRGVFSGNEEVPSSEEELSFRWVPLSEIFDSPVFPERIKQSLSEWGPNKKILFNETTFSTRN